MNIDDDLYRQVKARAAEAGRTVTSVVEDALRLELARLEARPKFRGLPVAEETGAPLPGVDLNDGRALRARLDEGLPIDALR